MLLAILLLHACSGDGAGPAASPDSADESGDDTGGSETGVPATTDALVLKDTPQNLLVISLDTTRRDRLSFFDDGDITPNLAAIFADGVLLEDHRSCSNWTAPSTYCAQSGNFQLDADVWPTGLREAEGDPLVTWPPAENSTLATILGGAGFDTTFVTSNSIFSLDMNGASYGFDREVRWFWAPSPNVVDMAIKNAADLGKNGKRWYYHVHFVDPHEQYEAPAAYWTDPKLDCPWDMTSINVLKQLTGGVIWDGLDDEDKELARACLFNVYEGELRYWDQELARFWSYVDDAGLLEDTLVVFWTDHGQSFGEHSDKFNHGKTLYDHENRSTAAFWARDIAPLHWAGPTIHQDLAPTILEALDVPLGEHTGTVLGHAPEDRMRVAFNYLVGYTVPRLSVVQENLKLMYAWDGTMHLYDLAADPDELDDQFDPSDPDVARLWDVLEPLAERTDEVWPGLDRTPPEL
jgi:arylsulfatase A-like enzyme